MTVKRLTILPLLALVPLASACGGDDGGTAVASTANCPEPCVVMRDNAFDPVDVTVRRGQTITWFNEDAVVHDVKNAREGEQPSSSLFGEGRTYRFTARQPGRIGYVCTIHPGMEGTITVR